MIADKSPTAKRPCERCGLPGEGEFTGKCHGYEVKGPLPEKLTDKTLKEKGAKLTDVTTLKAWTCERCSKIAGVEFTFGVGVGLAWPPEHWCCTPEGAERAEHTRTGLAWLGEAFPDLAPEFDAGYFWAALEQQRRIPLPRLKENFEILKLVDRARVRSIIQVAIEERRTLRAQGRAL